MSVTQSPKSWAIFHPVTSISLFWFAEGQHSIHYIKIRKTHTRQPCPARFRSSTNRFLNLNLLTLVICVQDLFDQMISALNQSFNHRLICLLTRSMSARSDFALSHRMKVLNDDEQYGKVLDLFEQRKEKNNINPLSSSIIIQALKACTQTGDLQRGQAIHRLVSSRVKTNSYILSSLIHFYSELLFTIEEVTLFSLVWAKCNVVMWKWASLFSMSPVREIWWSMGQWWRVRMIDLITSRLGRSSLFRICEEQGGEKSYWSISRNQESGCCDCGACSECLCSTADEWSTSSGQENFLQSVDIVWFPFSSDDFTVGCTDEMWWCEISGIDIHRNEKETTGNVRRNDEG